MSAYRWPSLDHLVAMTDDVGVLQHAVFDVPNRTCGYCTDDVGRALIVACDAAGRAAAGSGEVPADVARLVSTYLAFLHDAQLADGSFHGFMGYDRRWQDLCGTQDAIGRAVWGIGYAERHAPRESWRAVAGRMRRSALDAVRGLTYIRSRAYAALGLVHALAARPDDELELRAVLGAALEPIADAYDAHASSDWTWCEDVMTYDNARLCEALLRGGAALGNQRFIDAGLAMLAFYVAATIENDGSSSSRTLFVPVGSDGWYPRGGVKSRRGQQPLEAAALVDAALAALDVTDDARWREVAETAHGWYTGRNTHHAVLATESGCRDGLDDGGPNANMGAESTICYLMSAIALANRSSTSLHAVR
jgi:hypothetical protein